MRALLDVNVRIALLDVDHVHHGAAMAWLSANIEGGWASCPLTQNGCIRIMAQPGYPNALPPAQVAQRLGEAAGTLHHAFWADDLCLLETGVLRWESILGPRQVTDVYLLALAVRNGGRFVTFDRTVPRRVVRGTESEHLIVLFRP
jgi:toxin-antitoxin system PIN domain toxin